MTATLVKTGLSPDYDKPLNRFLNMKTAEVGFSKLSADAYRRDLSDFSVFLEKSNTSPAQADEARLADYLCELNERGLKPSAVARKISALRQYFEFLFLEGERGDNPAKNLRRPKPERILPKPLAESEINALIAAAYDLPAPYNDRAVCMLELAYGSGVRATELVSLPLKAVLSVQDHAFIRGKGEKDRLIPVSSAARKAIQAYLKKRDFFTGGRDNPYLFPSSRTGKHVTRIRFFQLVKELAFAAGIDPEKVSPHNFRHAFATHLLSGGADLRAVQTLLGHKHIDTTEIYTRVTDEDLKKMIFEKHPLAEK